MKAFWSIFFSLFFAALLFLGVDWLVANERITWLSLEELFILALAIFRLIRLFTYDLITQFIRDWFVNVRPDSFASTLGSLINCPWCIGLWFSFFVVFFYFATPYAWPIILILALAGLASIFQITANLIGWHAEGKKLDVKSRM